MDKIINGKEIAKNIDAGLSADVNNFISKSGVIPSLHIIMAGNSPPSELYVRNIERRCGKCGIATSLHRICSNTSAEELKNLICLLNGDNAVSGIMLQMPLPEHINTREMVSLILPNKDVDGCHPENLGKLAMGNCQLPPCTAAGIIQLLKSSSIRIAGTSAVILGRSTVVGKPAALMLLNENATVTMCHSHTQNPCEASVNADILISAIGKPEFVTEKFVKSGAVVIDVGTNTREDGTLVGDVKFDEVSKIAAKITPVPGGTGPMTISMLMKNILTAAKISISK